MTRYTEETADDTDKKIVTTLRELFVYLIFLVIMCVGRFHEKVHEITFVLHNKIERKTGL